MFRYCLYHKTLLFIFDISDIIPFCKHVLAKVTLTGKRDKVGHVEVTINNGRITPTILKVAFMCVQFYIFFCFGSHKHGH